MRISDFSLSSPKEWNVQTNILAAHCTFRYVTIVVLIDS